MIPGYAKYYVDRYVTITQICNNGLYIAYHPELPTAISQGDTPEAARSYLVEATEMAAGHLIDNGLPIPGPMSFPLAVDFAHGTGQQ